MPSTPVGQSALDASPASWSITRLAGVVLSTAMAYAGLSYLSLELAVPPGFASPIWPAAGVALAVVLLWGARVAAGVWIGSALLNVYIGTGHGTEPITRATLIAAAIIASGAALQALLGAGLVRKYAVRGLAMDTARDIVVLIGLGGAVASTCSSTIGTGTLVMAGAVPPSEAAYGWFNWWIGDTIGVVIAAPIVFALLARPGALWRKRLSTVALPTALCTAVIVLLFFAARDLESKRNQSRFERECTQIATEVESALRRHVMSAQALRALYDASEYVDAEEFAVFSHSTLLADPYLRALSWVPRVSGDDVDEILTRIEESYGTPARVRDTTGSQIEDARSRETLLLVTYVHPLATNHQALGLDLLSEERRASTMLAARDMGTPHVTDPITLVQEQTTGVLIVIPVYESGNVPATTLERRRQFKGVANAVLDVGQVLGAVADRAGELGIRIGVKDISGTTRRGLIAQTTDDALVEGTETAWTSLTFTSRIPFGQRHWEFEFTPTAAYVADQRSMYAWVLLLAGLILAGGLQVFLLTLTGRSSRIEVIVEEKTEALRDSQERFELAVTGASVGIWDVDLKTGMAYLSPRCCEILGRDEARGVHPVTELHRLLDGESFKVVRRAIVKHLRERTPLDVECQLRPAVGGGAWIHIRGQAIWNKADKAIRIAGSISDISNRKQAETAVARAYAQLQAFVTYAPAAVAMFDTEMRYVACSRKWLADYELEGQELIGRSHYEIFPDVPQRWRDIHAEVLTGVPRSCEEDMVEFADGTKYWLRWEVRPWPDEHGNVAGLVMLTENLTTLKLAQQELARQNEQLLEMTRRAHQFVDDVSHEFRTPLTIIKEYTSAIADGLCGEVSDEQTEFLGHIQSAVLDLNAMVEDFLDSSKIRAGRLRVDRREHDVSDVIERVKGVLDRKAAGRGVSLRYTIPPGLPKVFADDEKAGRTLINLATNAIKFSPQGSEVCVWVEAEGTGSIRIGVTDSGPGLAPGDREQLFKRFSQVTSQHQPSVKGFGLGLNIAKQLSWLNLGQIGVESEFGDGATFWFTLPCNDVESVMDAYTARLGEWDEKQTDLAIMVIQEPNMTADRVTALHRFLCATTRPTDVVWTTESNCTVIGPTSDVEGWRCRLSEARSRLQKDSPEGIEPITIEVAGRWSYPRDVQAARDVMCELTRGLHHV